MGDLQKSVKGMLKIFKSKNKKKILSLIKEIIVYTLIICFLKLPFILCRDISCDYFNKMNVDNVLDMVFYWAFEILYILFVIWMFKIWLLKRFSAKK